ncbi:MAG: zf-HC2 domain-containing protein [Acidobacteria bacterium]|nr:zf-HC2 domain-containing protein [Acidobacteriota bacterium]
MESDHQQAVASQAVERYLLGDLDPALRESFEKHFFGCPTCAEALRTGAVLEEAARALLLTAPPLNATDGRERAGFSGPDTTATQGTANAQNQAAANSSIGWMRRQGARVLVPWAVAVLFAAISLKQYRDLGAPRVESAAPLVLRADSRGAAIAASAPAGTAISLMIEVPTDGRYRWNVHTGDAPPGQGASAAMSGEAESVRGSLVIVVSGGSLGPGIYTVALSRAAASDANPLPDRLYYFELTRAQKN